MAARLRAEEGASQLARRSWRMAEARSEIREACSLIWTFKHTDGRSGARCSRGGYLRRATVFGGTIGFNPRRRRSNGTGGCVSCAPR